MVEATDAIVLQAADISFTTVTLEGADGRTIGSGTVQVDAKQQIASLGFGKTIPAGTYKLSIDYAGKIHTQATGFFALDYKGQDGSDKRALYTQFENSDARTFIPSWDEPFYKATFSLKAVVPKTRWRSAICR